MDTIDVYEYIAENSPVESSLLISKYGYDMSQTDQSLGDSLAQLVDAEGETALKDVMSLHPDKDIILSLFAGKKNIDKKVKTTISELLKPTSKDSAVKDSHIFIFCGALLIAAAIISKG